MADDPTNRAAKKEPPFARQVAVKAARKLRSQRGGSPGVWFGLGMSGLIGWSVAVPALLGALLGLWWDRHHPGGHSWTLVLLVAGLALGCANAWHWLVQEDKAMRDETEEKDE